MKLRPLMLGVCVLCACVVLLDLGLGRWALRDSEFSGRPVPPYGDVSQARFQAWANARKQALLANKAPEKVLIHDALLGWTNARNFHDKDNAQSTNSKALRGTREFDELPAPGALRVALFGESFIYGEEVPDGEDFCAQLGALDPTLEVMNYGVSGFGTDQALMRLRSEGVQSHAQVICIGVMLENIVRNVSRFTRLRNPYLKGVGIKPRFRLEHGELVLVPTPFATELEVCDAVLAKTLPDQVREFDMFAELPYERWIWKSSLARLYLGWRGSKARDYRAAWLDEQAEPFQLLLAILQAFDAQARAAGATRTIVLVFPPKEDLELVLAGKPRFWSGLARALESRHIEFLDFSDVLAARAVEVAGPGSNSLAKADTLYWRAHLNRSGNQAVARALLRRLRAP